MTEDELKAIEARADAATKGPWYSDGCDIWTDEKVEAGRFYFVASCLATHTDDMGRENRPNAELIAHSRTDIPALTAEIRRQQTALAEAGKPPVIHVRDEMVERPLLSTDVKDNK